jgi:hypothetical protein
MTEAPKLHRSTETLLIVIVVLLLLGGEAGLLSVARLVRNLFGSEARVCSLRNRLKDSRTLRPLSADRIVC